MKVQLIDNWRRCWRLWSAQMAALLVVLNVLQEQVLPLFGFAIPPNVLPWINAILGLAIIVLRAVAQPGALEGKEPPA